MILIKSELIYKNQKNHTSSERVAFLEDSIMKSETKILPQKNIQISHANLRSPEKQYFEASKKNLKNNFYIKNAFGLFS